jgi:hypothetical protein
MAYLESWMTSPWIGMEMSTHTNVNTQIGWANISTRVNLPKKEKYLKEEKIISAP